MRIDKNTTIRLGDRNIVKIKIGDSVIWQKTTEPDYFYVENTYAGSNTISVKQTLTGSPDNSLYAKTLQYSKDKTNWSTITLSSTAYTITLNQGEKVYFRGNEDVLNYYANDGAIQAITNILGTQTHTIGGNINTLVNYITPNELTLTQGVFAELFQNNTTITSAENLTLPATEMKPNCYRNLFFGCTSLVNAPELPATTLAEGCYRSLFEGCDKIVSAPELPATTLATNCYIYLFKSCTSLVNAPALPATTLAANCYKALFARCTSLVNAPELPATNLANNCYQDTFKGCTSLVNAPELPATTLAVECYRALFYGCTSLVNAPELPATTLVQDCYRDIFRDCSKLNNITVYANDISAYSCTSNWLKNVASSGTFRNLGSATYATDSISGIPTGWTEVKN